MGFRMWAVAAMAAGLGALPASAGVYKVPFEGIGDNGTTIQTSRQNYYGFDWGQTYYWESSYLDLNQRGNPDLPGPGCNYIYCFGPVPVFPPNGGNFVGEVNGSAAIQSVWQNSFISAWFTILPGSAGDVSIQGYNGANLVSTLNFTLGANTPTKIDLSPLSDVTRLVVQVSGGAGRVAIDDLTFSTTFTGGAVPEPSTWAMMLIGFAGLGWAYRRRGAQASDYAAA